MTVNSTEHQNNDPTPAPLSERGGGAGIGGHLSNFQLKGVGSFSIFSFLVLTMVFFLLNEPT